jgi:hypothetical protein
MYFIAPSLFVDVLGMDRVYTTGDPTVAILLSVFV